MLNVYHIEPNSRFAVTLNSVMPKLDPVLEAEVNWLWENECKRRGKGLFNGRIMSAFNFTTDSIDGCIVEYRYLIAQKSNPELFNHLQIRPVAVSGLLECRDGVVFGRRSHALTQDAGAWELVPSGGLDMFKINADHATGNIDIMTHAIRELYEEVGVKSSLVSSIAPFCLVYDEVVHVIDIGVAIKSQISADTILELHRNNASAEYDELQIVSHKDIGNFVQLHTSRLVNVSRQLIQCYFNI